MKKISISAVILLALLSGCSGKDAAEHYQDALTYSQNNQYNAAVIELKSAISQAPDNIDYRLLLARVYLKTGDMVSAEKEFERALRNGADPETVAVEVIQTSYLAENHQNVLSLFNDTEGLSPKTEHYLKFYRAMAEVELGATANAIAIFDELINSEYPDLAAYAEAALLLNARNITDALNAVQQVNKDSLIAKEALLLTAQLQLLDKQTDNAIANLQQYIAQVPRALRVRLILAQTYVQQQQFAEADEQLAYILQLAPEHGLSNYLKATIEYQKQDYTKAKEHIDKAINARFSNTPSRILAGIVSHQLGLEAQALSHLSTVKNSLHTFPPAQRLYTLLQLRAGETADAASSLSNADFTEQDLSLVAGTAFQLISQGDQSMAAEIISRYENMVVPQDGQSLSTLGSLKLGLPNRNAEGIKNLEQALMMDPGLHDTRLVLAGSYIRQKQFDKAAELADEWLKTEETRNAGYNLKALTYLLQQDIENGKLMLAEAQKADSDNVFTLYMMAAVARDENDIAKSDALLKQAIDLRSDYVPALIAYFTSMQQQGTPQEAVDLVERSHKAHPDNNQIRMLLANLYQSRNNFADVITILKPISDTQQQFTPAFYNLLVNAYVRTNQADKALALAERWFNSDDKNIRAGLAYANLLANDRRFNDAILVLDKQLKAHPKEPILLRTKIAAQSENGDQRGALATFELLPQELANSAEMLYHKGRIQILNKQISPGLETLNKSYSITPSPATAIAIADAYAKDISYRRAVSFLEEHFTKHGKNSTELQAFYANLLIEDDVNKAVAEYGEIVQQSPDSIIALNNYAWVLLEVGKITDARTYAEQALKLNDRHPDVLDTYGRVLLEQGEPAKAKAQFEQSLAIRPGHAEVQLNLAQALINNGEQEQAGKVLAAVKTDNVKHLDRAKELQQKLH
ncbi:MULTISPECIES: XrtA/PEP-CTERM system TPR-repeat protein PrsT [unclassified Arsukibacterium]|uniref:XrtA/PEP-CTERM system TPR-repeat protein PrsT n=1 Tax=unclassified Arsukibacterium TaxID=2635278 RepID=UPI000C8D0A71|nr:MULTISPECIES: XrtA/PEP-CTERM system TPR-repeat protein PrsT [unclassified Arsukibacterium]MAA95157.1 PEP-CTERM system TPR-repeat protein PrsT [Rheinheimera sp.]HAW94394.1 PEP-CTERM system TPR-repeat protein PrsT [Candidatus Azambacteria bacterium]|tara:strand:- start:18139 stop:20898 length:2760 start_codon:yes stop_codon:yes gene_type:complete